MPEEPDNIDGPPTPPAPPMTDCSIDVGTFKATFSIVADAADGLINDVIKLMARFTDGITYKPVHHVDIGTYKTKFDLVDGAVANDFTNELLKNIVKSADFIMWHPVLNSVTPKPARKRNKSPGPWVRARHQILDLKRRNAIPPAIDAQIAWVTDERGQIGLSTRGPLDKRTTDAYWELVDGGLIDEPIPRPVRKGRGRQSSKP